jgi:hypothetical protein
LQLKSKPNKLYFLGSNQPTKKVKLDLNFLYAFFSKTFDCVKKYLRMWWSNKIPKVMSKKDGKWIPSVFFWQAILRVLITDPKGSLSHYQITFALSKHDKYISFAFSKTFGYEKYIYECDEAIKYLSKSYWSPHLKEMVLSRKN